MNIKIKNIREAINVSQTEMAKMIGIYRTRYVKYEKAERRIPTDIAHKIVDIANENGIAICFQDIYPRTEN